MNIISIKINNYKSLGNERNTLQLEPNTTALIGKNESGKSNILDAIGNLPYFHKSNSTYYTNKNRGTNDEVSLVFEMQFDKKEIDDYQVSNQRTEIIFTNSTNASFTGGLSEIILKDIELLNIIDEITKTKGNSKVWNIGNNEQNKEKQNLLMDNLNNISSTILLNFEQHIKSHKQLLHKTYKDYDALSQKLDKLSFSLSNYYRLLPHIFYREKDHQLEYSYDYEKIKEILKHKNDIFYRLMISAKIEDKEIMKAFEERIEGERQNIRAEIEEKIANNIGHRFNDFYTQETVKFTARFEGNLIKFFVSTNKGKQMQISERSNGLRWYLSLFIDIVANDFEDKSVLFLFDEPGVQLHVNAQKELMHLFDDLSYKGNQVIYTTHSPSMINGEDILNVRVVEKNDSGISIIYKNGYDQRLSSKSKMETLSPLIKAIGADLRFNLGPQHSKLNIITEGITDYMYIKAMMYYLNIEEPPNIIPSAGVENINRIASILLGWGCDFRILLDFDHAGRKEYNVLVDKLNASMKEIIIFVNGQNEPELSEMKTSPITIEELISEKDYSQLTHSLSNNKDNKVLVAKEFYDKVTAGEIQPDSQTVEAFAMIFNKLNIANGKVIPLEV